MRIVRFLAAASPLALLGAALAGMLGGAALAGAVGMIDRLLADGGWRSLGQGPQGLAYLAGALAVGGLTYLSGSLVAGLMQRRLAGLRQQLCERILATELVRLEKLGGAGLLTLLSDDLNRLAQGAAALPVLVIDLSICLAILAYIAVLSPALFLLVAGGQALTLLAMAVFFGRYETRLRAAQPGRQALMQCFQLLVGATKPLKQRQALRDAFLDQLYRPTVQQVMRDADRCNALGVGMDSVAKVAFLLAVGSILLAAAWLPDLVGGEALRSAVLAYMFMVTPFSSALNTLARLFEADAALAKIQRSELAAAEPAGPAAAVGAVQSLGLRGARYRHRDEAGRPGFALGPLDLELRRGEIVLLKGGNGSGKTTLAKLLAGLYRPDEGGLLLDGAPLETGAARYRECFGASWSDDVQPLIHLPAAAGATQAGEALWRSFGLDAALPFRTGWVDCSALSTGQRQRAALVGLLLGDSPFLVLDEWAANQDPAYRRRYYQDILPGLRRRGLGVLLISHDDEAEACADRVVELRAGQALVRPAAADPMRAPQLDPA